MRNVHRILIVNREEARCKCESDLKQGVRLWIGFIWLTVGLSGGFFWTRWWIFGFYKRL